jgi:MHS family proline/betaine transporter-like MFS transporter
MSKNLMLGCFIGNALEWFDFAIYGCLASVLGQLFFPMLDPYAALLSSYGVFAAAFIMRPIGAILIGHLGDKGGRKRAFLWSLVGMAVPTAMIGLLPVYEQIGICAPLSLIFCRLIQGLSIGGEFSGSIILLVEHAPPHRKSFFSIWADMGSSIGMIVASVAILLLNVGLTEAELLAWGWRVPFLVSSLAALGGYYLRRQLRETPEFLAQRNSRASSLWPLRIIFQKYKRKLILVMGFLMVNTIGYYLLIIFIPNQNLSNHPKIYGSASMVFSLIMMMPAMVWGAILSDKIGQVRCLVIGYSGCLLLALPLLYSAKYGTYFQQLVCQGLFSLALGFCFGPRSSFAAQIFPTAIRYSGVAISYNLGNALFGGTAPLVCALMMEQTETLLAPAAYLGVASLVSLVSVVLLGRDLSREKKPISIDFADQRYILDYKTRMLRKFSHSQSSPEYRKLKKS